MTHINKSLSESRNTNAFLASRLFTNSLTLSADRDHTLHVLEPDHKVKQSAQQVKTCWGSGQHSWNGLGVQSTTGAPKLPHATSSPTIRVYDALGLGWGPRSDTAHSSQVMMLICLSANYTLRTLDLGKNSQVFAM